MNLAIKIYRKPLSLYRLCHTDMQTGDGAIFQLKEPVIISSSPLKTFFKENKLFLKNRIYAICII